MSKLLFFIIFIFSSPMVFADYVIAGRATDNNLPIFYDPDTILKRGNMVDVWTVNNFTDEAVRKDPSVKSYASKERIDCVEGTAQSLTTNYYSDINGKGRIVQSDREVDKKVYFSPTSLMAAVAKRVCK